MFYLTSNLNFSFINFSLLSSHHAPLWKVWVCLHYHPKLPPLQNWTSPNSPPSLHRASGASQATTSLSAIQWTHPSLKHRERSLGRKNTLIKYFAFTEKKKLSKCSCFVLKICIFSILVRTKLLFSHRLLFQTHHIVPNPALFVQLYLQIHFYNWLSYRVFKEWISEQKSLRRIYKVVQFTA